MENYYMVTLWTKDHNVTSMNFLKFENAMIFANQHKEEFISLRCERFMDFVVK